MIGYVSGTLVELADFSLKEIERVQTGDCVLTRDGTPAAVTACAVNAYAGNVLRVEFAGLGKNLPWRITPEHNVWRIPGDGRRHSKTGVNFTPASSIISPARHLGLRDYIATPLLRLRDDVVPRFSGWLLGMYLAEGCCLENGRGQYGAKFTLGADDEVLGISAKLVELCQRQMGKRVDVYVPKDRPDVRTVTVWDYEFADWCKAHGGELAKEKRLSAQVLAYGVDFIAEMLIGFSDGDGWIQHTRGNFDGLGATTSSKKLAYQFQRIAQIANIPVSMGEVGAGRGYNLPNNPDAVSYQLFLPRRDVGHLLAQHSVKFQRSGLSVSAAQAGKSAVTIRDGYTYRRVNKISHEAYVGDVYSLTVAGADSYIAGNVGAAAA